MMAGSGLWQRFSVSPQPLTQRVRGSVLTASSPICLPIALPTSVELR